MTLADRFFENIANENKLEEELFELFDAIGIGDRFDDYIMDSYDWSLEITGVKGQLELTPEQLQKIWDAGFDRCWICAGPKGYERHSMPQKYYSQTCAEGGG